MPGLLRLLAALALAAALVLTVFMVRSGPADRSAGLWSQAPPEVQAVLWPAAREPGPFRLITQHHQTFGPERLRDRWSLVFFGYLDCPDVCQMTLYALREFRSRLLAQDPRAGGEVQFVFVTVDPLHDTPERVRDYLEFFDPDFIGLAGDPTEVEVLASALAVHYLERVETDGARSIDHTSSVMVFDPNGRAVAALPPPHEPGAMLDRFNRLRDHLGG